jgi:hypothetical protein
VVDLDDLFRRGVRLKRLYVGHAFSFLRRLRGPTRGLS